MSSPSDRQALEDAYGPASDRGFGSASFFQTGVAADALEAEALAVYRRFVGDGWTPERDAAWRSTWRQVYTRADGAGRDVVAELRGLSDAAARIAVPLLLDLTDDPAQARAALAAAMDDPSVTTLAAYTVGDGEALSGLLVAARRATGDAVFVIALLD